MALPYIRISLAFLLLIQGACAEKKQLTEMHGATVEMRDQTKQLGKTSEEMNQTTKGLAETSDKMLTNTSQLNETSKDMLHNTQELKEKTEETKQALDEMKGITDELYDANRQGMALGLRRELIKKLFEMPAMENKLAIAAQYFLSFEIQLWQGFGQDQQDQARQKLARDATMEFLLEAEGLAPKKGKVVALSEVTEVKWIDSLMSNNSRSSFNALAAMMHKLNRKQEKQVANRKTSSMSLLDLVTVALDYDLQYQSGKIKLSEVPEFAKEVIFHKAVVVQLLQTRLNVLPTIFMARSSGLTQKTLFEKLKQLYYPKQKWDLNFNEIHPGITEYYNRELLDQAVNTRRLLVKIGIGPRIEKDVRKLYSQMNVVSSKRSGVDAQHEQKMLKNLNEIFQAEEQVDAESPSIDELQLVPGP